MKYLKQFLKTNKLNNQCKDIAHTSSLTIDLHYITLETKLTDTSKGF
jgi:hypothetical protein